MGKIKYQKEIEELFKKSPIADFKSIERIIKNKKNVKNYTKQLIRNLLLKRKIKKLTKGYYTLHNDNSLAVFCFKPAYLGLQDALSFHNLWEQETIPIVITIKKVRPGIRKIMDNNILIRRLNKKYFFGFDYQQQDNFYFPYSDIEKTFIDMIYFKEKLDEETIKNLIKKINKKKLNNYLKLYPKRIKKIILNILNKL
ncbi:MAG: hypothetical protein AB1571_04215 [Nanoarchaeota archaeon]